MSFSFTARLPLSRHAVDRDHEARANPALIDTLLAHAATRVLAVWRGQALLSARSTETATAALNLLAPAALSAVTNATLRLYLGRSLAADASEPVGTPLLAVVLNDDEAALLEPDVTLWGNLRTLATELSDRDTGLFAEALGVINWHSSHTHCPRCGAATVVEESGWVRRCPIDNSQIFPRTDPAVIVLITDADDRILLGSNALWENNRYSLLAGFVEPGESLESAVIREMFEESGLHVVDPVYLGSQPWPFPASIMFGFTVKLAPGQSPEALTPDGEEILDLRWFSRDELRAAAGDIVLPGPSSIAHAIIEHWFGGPLVPQQEWVRG